MWIMKREVGSGKLEAGSGKREEGSGKTEVLSAYQLVFRLFGED
jgi:hypothetical protein